jgi:tetratricopeptide (TPR) repeat protein
MLNPKICPRCHLNINPQRLAQMPAVCDCCGHVLSSSESSEQVDLEKSLLKSAIGSSIFLLLFLAYIGSWGSYSLEIIPLKIGHWTGRNSAADMERLAQIGLDLKKLDMVEQEYSLLAKNVDPKNYARLGKFQLSRMEYKEAAEAYRQYFQLGNRDYDARYNYARALSESGRIDDAAKNFEYLLKARPGVRQVTVVQRYVSMLVKAQRFDQAQRVIEHVRKQDPAASRFMDTEYKVIAERKNSRT